jgi:hypothetical protein
MIWAWPERRSLSAQQAAEPLVANRPIERNLDRLGGEDSETLPRICEGSQGENWK